VPQTAVETVTPVFGQLAQALVLLLTLWLCIDWARRRNVARLDAALLMVSVAVAVGLDLWRDLTGSASAVVGHIVVTAIVLHPLLLLRLVSHFRAVPGWILGCAGAAFVISTGLIWVEEAVVADAADVTLPLLFALFLAYGARSLVTGARHAQGVVRRRMGLVAAGALLVALSALLLLVDSVGAVPGLRPALPVLLLGAAILYTLGLASPPWLARAWQQTDVQQFLRASAGSAGETTDTVLRRLCSTARHAAGGQAAAFARWNEERKRLELELRGERALVGGPLPADGLVARQWTFRRPFVADDRSEVREACLRMAPGLECDALLGVPIITPARVWGLLIVFLRRAPALPDEDLRLLSLVTEHTAVLLDQASLVEQLRRQIAELRGEPVVDDTPLDES
jgi:hypothetical protein